MKRKTIIVAAVTTIVIVFVTFLLGLNNSKAEVHIFGITNQSILYQNLQKVSYLEERHSNLVDFTFIPAFQVENGTITAGPEVNESLEEDLIAETLYIWYTFENNSQAFQFITKLRETFPGYSWSEILGLLPQKEVKTFESKIPELKQLYISEVYQNSKREIDAFSSQTNSPTSIITINDEIISQDRLITSYRIENYLLQEISQDTNDATPNGLQVAYSSKDCNIQEKEYGIFRPENSEQPCTYIPAPEITITRYTPSEDQYENTLADSFLEANFKNYSINTITEQRDTVKLVLPVEAESNPSFEIMLNQEILRPYQDGYRFDIPIQSQ